MFDTENPTASRKSRRLLVLGAVALVALTVGCGDDAAKSEPTSTDVTTTQPTDTEVETTDDVAGTAGAEVVRRMAYEGLEVEFSEEELSCIDGVFDGVDLEAFGDGFDPFGEYVDDDVMARAGRMFDECLGDESRVALIAASFGEAGLGTDEQAMCVAERLDAIVLDVATYEEVLTQEVDVNDQLTGAFAECGLDAGAEESSNACESEQLTIETAIEAYYAANGVDAESWDDLVPDYLSEDMSDRWELVIGADGVLEVVGIGDCERAGR